MNYSIIFFKNYKSIPIKDNNAGKELSAATISRWICTTIVDSHATFKNSKGASIKAHEVQAVATSSQGRPKVDLQTVMKAGRWSSGGIFTSFYLRDLCPQADSLRKTGPLVAAGGVVCLPACLATFTFPLLVLLHC